MKRSLFLSLLIVFFTTSFMLLLGCNNQTPTKEQSSISKVTPKIPDSKVWESFYDDCYYNKTNIVKSDNSVTVWIYIVTTDGERKKIVDDLKKDGELEKSKKYENYDHHLSRIEMKCMEMMYQWKGISIDYNHDGDVLDSYDFGDTDYKWTIIVPDSFHDRLYRKICVTPKKPLKKK
jgi:hypothetical protein